MAGKGFRFHVITEPLLLYRKHWNSLADVSETSFEEQRLIICEENKDLQSKKNQRKRELQCDLTFRVKNPFENLKQKKQRKTILVALPFMIVGGVDTLFLNVFSHLAKSFNILFFTTMYFDDEFGDNTSRFREISPHIYHLHRFLHKDEQRTLFIKYLVTCYKPDAMLIAGSEFTYHMLPDLRKANPAMKVIDTLFNEEGHMENNRKYSKYIDLNIVENEKISDVLQQKFGESPAKIRHIPNGISLGLIDKKLPTDKARKKLGLPDKKFIVTFLGRFSEEKNPAVVVEFAKRLQNQDILFLMAGKGPMYDEIKQLIWQENLNKMILTPGFLNTTEVLSATDVLILPSILDGRPNAVLEAMAMGVPVIASKVGGLPSLVVDGENGFLISPDKRDIFVQKIIWLKNNPQILKKMGLQARKFAEEFLDDRIMHRKYEEAIDYVLKA
jgi:glycosyltransferase involved in cell wall biosynthesis